MLRPRFMTCSFLMTPRYGEWTGAATASAGARRVDPAPVRIAPILDGRKRRLRREAERPAPSVQAKATSRDGEEAAVTYAVRPCCSTAELREAVRPIWHYFGRSTPSDEQ